MTDALALRFARWREHGDPALLAEVFDAAAPELLRLALHLSVDIAAAEDLLQATFVAAIQSAPRFDEGRELLPWLVSILTNHARAEGRRARRAGGALENADALEDRAQDPSLHAAQRELSAAALRAIDGLAEPYRQPIVLRVVHGMAPGDIAHVLGRSPATVRTQLHRGLEMLRKAVPTGLSLAALATAGRGLDAVRTAVLAQARAAAAHAAVTTTTGSVLMWIQNPFVAATVVAVLGAVGWFGPGRWRDLTTTPGSMTGTAPLETAAGTPSLDVADHGARNALASARELAPTRLTAIVLRDGAPLSNTAVALLVLELRHGQLLMRDPTPFGPQTTDALGRFEVMLPAGTYSLRCDGVMSDDRVEVAPDTTQQVTFHLVDRTLEVQLLDAAGAPVANRLLRLGNAGASEARDARTDATGRATFTRLTLGTWSVWSVPLEFEGATVTDLRELVARPTQTAGLEQLGEVRFDAMETRLQREFRLAR